jgi:hypothetical protein
MHNIKNETWALSKSSFLKGKQCAKYLFLDKYKKKERTPPTKELLALFKQGHTFEDRFRYTEFPDGINIKDELGWNFGHYNSRTKSLFAEHDTCTLFEGGIIEDDILILMDVIHKNVNGTFDFYEVKLQTEISEVIWQDVRIQYYVCKMRFGSLIQSFNIVHRIGKDGWVIKDVLGELEGKLDGIENDIEAFREVLEMEVEPGIEMGAQCGKPYVCPFVEYCERGEKVCQSHHWASSRSNQGDC